MGKKNDEKEEILIGRIMKASREVFGLSQVEFAKRLGTSQSEVCKWEKGIHAPNAIQFIRFCQKFNISADLLLHYIFHPESTHERKRPPKTDQLDLKYFAADLSGSDLSGTHVIGADFTRANLTDCDFSNAYLMFSRFCDADLRYADFSDAILSSCDFRGFEKETNLTNTITSNADLRGAMYNDKTILPFRTQIARNRGMIYVTPLLEHQILDQMEYNLRFRSEGQEIMRSATTRVFQLLQTKPALITAI